MKDLLDKVIYQVYVRNFTEEGTFKACTQRLDYIKSLGTDIVYLLPVNPIGMEGRKGTLGSPYSISDYLQINEELGTPGDLILLINNAHRRNMKVMIDMVFNHTSRDSWIVNNRPQWMYHDENGNFANKVGNWSDVYDLDYRDNDELIKYMTGVILYYCHMGVDGFRFDVGNLIPKEFYIHLKKVLDRDYPDTILLCEAVGAGFTQHIRETRFNALSDAEMYECGFDLIYGYNNYDFIKDYLETGNKNSLAIYKGMLAYEEAFNPRDGLRVRGIENHDQKRLIEFNENITVRRNLAAYPVFLRGPMFIYNGLETKADHRLTLFEKDTMDDSIDEEWYSFIQKLVAFKKDERNNRLLSSTCSMKEGENLLLINSYDDGTKAYGLIDLDLSGKEVTISDPLLKDGNYIDYLSGKRYRVKNNTLTVSDPLFLFEE